MSNTSQKFLVWFMVFLFGVPVSIFLRGPDGFVILLWAIIAFFVMSLGLENIFKGLGTSSRQAYFFGGASGFVIMVVLAQMGALTGALSEVSVGLGWFFGIVVYIVSRIWKFFQTPAV